MDKIINLMPDETLLNSGIVKYIKWDYEKCPHMVLFGGTGSGKTYCLKLILGRISKYIPDCKIILCDYKGDTDFSFASNMNNFYRFEHCMTGLDRAIEILRDRQRTENNREFIAFMFDEWASFINSLSKKESEYAKQCLSQLLMLGRSFNIHVFISQQRVDSAYFNSARDNFSVIVGLGVLSKESVEMMFNNYKDKINRNKQQGHGSMIIGSHFYDIFVPYVYDIEHLHSTILSVMI